MEGTIYRNIKDLKLLENNPRKIDKESMDILIESIKNNPEYFEARPIILSDRTGELVIIAGNQRYKAAKKIGLKQVPTFLLSGLTEEKEREIVIRDNVSNGEWDWNIIKEEWNLANVSDWGVDIPDWIYQETSQGDLDALFEDTQGKEKPITISVVVPKEFEDTLEDIKKSITITLGEWKGCKVR